MCRRARDLHGGPEGPVASPTASLERGAALKTLVDGRPVVGDVPPAGPTRQAGAREGGVCRAPVGLSHAALRRCL